jgi:UDP-N-acetylmuramyl-tripeptide synthetase
MMRLKDLLDITGLFRDMDIPAVWDDSRRVTPGSLFAALPPASKVTQDGKIFIQDALGKGAAAVILAHADLGDFPQRYPRVCFCPVDDPRAAFRAVVERFYGHSSQKVRVLGVTGTNGKTTITYFLESIIKAGGKRSGVVGTVNCRVGGRVVPSKNTTPGFLDNQVFLAGLAADGVEYAVMEVSSHALAQKRVDLIDFRGAIFTNLTGDHLDFHKTMEEYFKAKAGLFSGLSTDAFAVVNTDDPYGQRLLAMTRARVITYGIDAPADVTAHIEEFTLAGTRFKVKFFGQEIEVRTHFIGRHNLYNILAACAAAIGEGFEPGVICQGIEALGCVPGRLERVECGKDFCVFIDYAHTDDGLKNVLTCLKAVPHNRLIVVFGCGGDRDRTKRPRMGKIACELADHAVVTSDNPRSEDPQAIMAQIIAGFTQKNYEVVPDREEAIARALSLARKDDIVLLAGKGHETYQILKDRTIDCVERDIVMRILTLIFP